MNKLEKIKKDKDEYLTKYVFAMIKFIKKTFNIPQNERIFYLDYRRKKYIFLYKYQLIYADYTEDKNKKLSGIKISHIIYMLKFPCHTLEDFIVVAKDNIDENKAADEFLNWIDSPCSISQEIDEPYYKIIEYLQNYKKTTLKYKNYLFYVKKDNDFSYSLNFYMKDIKNNVDVKIYIPNGNWAYSYTNFDPPDEYRQIVIDDNEKLSDYKKTKYKKVLLEFLNLNNEFFNVPNYHVLELLKQTIVPVEYELWWGICHMFDTKVKPYSCIFADDFVSPDKEPYFVITDGFYWDEITKAAVLEFKHAKYATGGLYKQGFVKFKHWELSKEFLKDLTEYLNAKPDENDIRLEDEPKTNWQHMISLYNHNTGHYFGTELPPDLPMPDYTVLAEDSTTLNIENDKE